MTDDTVTVHEKGDTRVTLTKGRSGVVVKVESHGIVAGYCYSFYHAALGSVRYASSEKDGVTYPNLKAAVEATLNPTPAVRVAPAHAFRPNPNWHKRRDFE